MKLSTSSSHLFQSFSSRKLLLHTPLATAAPPSFSNGHKSQEPYMGDNSFDANVVMILSVLLCALICALGLNSIIRCALRCSSRVTVESSLITSARLANTGVKRKALNRFPTLTYMVGLNLPGLDAECIICLSEFGVGDKLRVLPKCNHGFHVRCIDKWLMSHSSCPTCRNCLINTCEKIVGCSQASVPEPLPLSIVSLEPEGLIRNYRAIC
ncbi:hypothetical protein GIB67_029253 [Kingdonia uniflora]|uniref:RING-type domain-containing protein n=1 Tax=Kingdonia uniflora TaxID=39325 RepID=A0A7J7N8P4_9MAGN|nr:hypothetical protein GIB67_029253 [Kingdonia uniflora]